jgi:hypothetical protein
MKIFPFMAELSMKYRAGSLPVEELDRDRRPGWDLKATQDPHANAGRREVGDFSVYDRAPRRSQSNAPRYGRIGSIGQA